MGYIMSYKADGRWRDIPLEDDADVLRQVKFFLGRIKDGQLSEITIKSD